MDSNSATETRKAMVEPGDKQIDPSRQAKADQYQ
jgi:hypothetical protein